LKFIRGGETGDATTKNKDLRGVAHRSIIAARLGTGLMRGDRCDH